MESNNQETEKMAKPRIINHRERNNREDNREKPERKILPETLKESVANETAKS